MTETDTPPSPGFDVVANRAKQARYEVGRQAWTSRFARGYVQDVDAIQAGCGVYSDDCALWTAREGGQ